MTILYLDRESSAAYYLAFDQLLARAPVREGVVDLIEGRVVALERLEPAAAARAHLIRAQLLRASGARRDEIERELRAARLGEDDAPGSGARIGAHGLVTVDPGPGPHEVP